MRVLIVNTSEMTGGAAIAANRLMAALNASGVDASMLVRDKSTDNPAVTPLPCRLKGRYDFLAERLRIFTALHFSKKHLFEIDIADTGTDITRLPEFQQADVIHLHWINQGMLSLTDIGKICRSGKPVVWTLHDFWPATAICHYPHECKAYTSGCHNCPYIPGGGSAHDLAARRWRRKSAVWSGAGISYVACSQWLADCAKESALLAGANVTNIPNPIDTGIFHPADKAQARDRLGLPHDKRLILFTSQRITDPRKGIDYFIEACGRLAERIDDAAVVILGSHADEVTNRLPLPVYRLGYVSDTDKIVDIYNAADTYVLPSLEDNLPNTIMEAMACGVPCVGFDVGGIPEMIEHRHNGYVAAYRDAADLAEGIKWILHNADYTSLSVDAVAKVRRDYSQAVIAARYTELYNALLSLT